MSGPGGDELYALHSVSGMPLWKVEGSGSGLTAAAGTVYVDIEALDALYLYALRGSDGAQVGSSL